MSADRRTFLSGIAAVAASAAVRAGSDGESAGAALRHSGPTVFVTFSGLVLFDSVADGTKKDDVVTKAAMRALVLGPGGHTPVLEARLKDLKSCPDKKVTFHHDYQGNEVGRWEIGGRTLGFDGDQESDRELTYSVAPARKCPESWQSLEYVVPIGTLSGGGANPANHEDDTVKKQGSLLPLVRGRLFGVEPAHPRGAVVWNMAGAASKTQQVTDRVRLERAASTLVATSTTGMADPWKWEFRDAEPVYISISSSAQPMAGDKDFGHYTHITKVLKNVSTQVTFAESDKCELGVTGAGLIGISVSYCPPGKRP